MSIVVLIDIAVGAPIALNLLETVALYDVGGCFVDHSSISVFDWEVLILAANIIMNESVTFEVFVHKDTRVARASQDVRVSGLGWVGRVGGWVGQVLGRVRVGGCCRGGKGESCTTEAPTSRWCGMAGHDVTVSGRAWGKELRWDSESVGCVGCRAQGQKDGEPGDLKFKECKSRVSCVCACVCLSTCLDSICLSVCLSLFCMSSTLSVSAWPSNATGLQTSLCLCV